MWLIAKYQPVGIFSLKVGVATSTGAKTLFLPTPFAIRTALLDAAIRTHGLKTAVETFEIVKTLNIAAFPPEKIVVTNLFTKVLKPKRSDSKSKKANQSENDELDEQTENSNTEDEEAMQRTISFREYAYLAGDLDLAFDGTEANLRQIRELLYQVTYFGKRGSFFQLLNLSEQNEISEGFVILKSINSNNNQINGTAMASYPLGIIQVMDDWGPSLNFDKLNIYSEESIRLGQDRIQEYVMLPYHLTKSSRGFSYYERI